MLTARFEIEFITPAFLGGAEPHAYAELRAPSLRGQLRWWFRALGHSRADEEALFGSTAGETGSASGFILRVSNLRLPGPVGTRVVPASHRFAPPVGAEDLRCERINSPEGYLAFNLRRPRENSPYKRGMIPEGTRFDLIVSTHRLSKDQFNRLCQVIRLFACFGSVGTRSRRTFGCLAPISESGNLPDVAAALDNFTQRKIDWRELPELRGRDVAEIRRHAGAWLKEHRTQLKHPVDRRGEMFGMAGEHARKASPIILRPFKREEHYGLGLLVPRQLPAFFAQAIA